MTQLARREELIVLTVILPLDPLGPGSCCCSVFPSCSCWSLMFISTLPALRAQCRRIVIRFFYSFIFFFLVIVVYISRWMYRYVQSKLLEHTADYCTPTNSLLAGLEIKQNLIIILSRSLGFKSSWASFKEAPCYNDFLFWSELNRNRLGVATGQWELI